MSDNGEQEENIPVIVDCDVLEAAKENIQPLAKGRRVTALSVILSTPHAQRESRLAATRNRLRINVQLALENTASHETDTADNEGDVTDTEESDPLEAYCRYVYWVVENYPQGHSAESGLLELLEEATRVLKDHQGGKWRSDPRYLKLWVLYASYVEKPAIIYKFCMVNEIGTSHALLYEEFAVALERAGRKAHADETYRIGIARKAAPLERLEIKYKEFQKRMMASPILPPAEDGNASGSATSPSTAQNASRRTALGEATSSSRTSTRVTRASSRSASSTPTIPQPQTTRAQSNARLQIFVDPSSEDALGSAATNEEDQHSPWPDLGTRKSRVKENIKEATKATGTTLRQPGRAHRATASQSGSKISVYRDSEPTEDEDTAAKEEADSPETPPPPAPPGAASKVKVGRSIAVFRDAEPDRAPSSKKSTGKSPIAVFRDDNPVSPPTLAGSTRSSKGKAVSKSGIPIFRDEEAPSAHDRTAGPSKSLKGKNPSSKSSIAIYHDEEPDTQNMPVPEPKGRSSGLTKGKSSIAVFRDDVGPSTKLAKGKTVVFRDDEAFGSSGKPSGKIAVFRDEDPQEPATKTKGKIPVFRDGDTDAVPLVPKAKSKIPVFCDEDPQPVVGAGSAKTKITVLRDEEVASKPSFMPYRDDDTPKSPTAVAAPLGRTRSLGSGSSVGLGITGLGAVAGRSMKMSSEAEALRKDPLKNYAEDQRVVDLDK